MVRKNQALSLRNQFSVTEIDEDWDLMKINFNSQEEMIERVLWYLDSIKVLSPNDLRNEILNRLKELADG
jgi:predicted DNA-binding transcriptional regulator YafY